MECTAQDLLTFNLKRSNYIALLQGHEEEWFEARLSDDGTEVLLRGYDEEHGWRFHTVPFDAVIRLV